MRVCWWCLFVLFVGCYGSTSESYTAAVVEFLPVNYESEVIAAMEQEILLRVPDEFAVSSSYVNAVKMLNLKRYEHFVKQAKEQEADIIVFPEDTTTGWPIGFDNGRDGALPWLEQVPPMQSQPYLMNELQFSSPAVFYASQFAYQNNITVVIDIGEVVWCNGTQTQSECTPDGRWQFNTQLAFNPSGALIGKHRKLHLFLADTEIFNYPEESLDTFESFGVEFGMLVCFDIWFSYPGFALASQKNIENFVLSSWWENNGTLPLVSAVNMQQSFARAAQSNLLACSVGLGFMNSGSGIYNGVSGEQSYNFDPQFLQREDVLIVQELPKSPRSSSFDSPKPSKRISVDSLSHIRAQHNEKESRIRNTFISLPDSPSYVTLDVAPGKTIEATATNNDLECFFNVTFATGDNINSTSTFVAMAYQGPYFDDLLQADLCAIYRCADRHFNRGNCETLTIESDVAFTEIEITGSFSSQQNVYAMASQNKGQLLPMSSIMIDRSSSFSAMKVFNSSVQIVNTVLYAPSIKQNYY
uniref:CN hydrolase domain-containing protein n=1 Tax=Vannella robusta TaxID=1487602 RepID=A0A7S4I841_9EUKA|mmetsp:Transcript_2179/g.2660  ORF Transcript_2179/g.2660 Transcript_2179/m.2660 type:complete len:528 (+) Transcript_2179:3-1586(+)